MLPTLTLRNGTYPRSNAPCRIQKVAGIPKLLSQGSESPVKKTDIIKRVGELHGFRQKLNLEDENLLDEPEFLWEDARLHGQSPTSRQTFHTDANR